MTDQEYELLEEQVKALPASYVTAMVNTYQQLFELMTMSDDTAWEITIRPTKIDSSGEEE